MKVLSFLLSSKTGRYEERGRHAAKDHVHQTPVAEVRTGPLWYVKAYVLSDPYLLEHTSPSPWCPASSPVHRSTRTTRSPACRTGCSLFRVPGCTQSRLHRRRRTTTSAVELAVTSPVASTAITFPIRSFSRSCLAKRHFLGQDELIESNRINTGPQSVRVLHD